MDHDRAVAPVTAFAPCRVLGHPGRNNVRADETAPGEEVRNNRGQKDISDRAVEEGVNEPATRPAAAERRIDPKGDELQGIGVGHEGDGSGEAIPVLGDPGRVGLHPGKVETQRRGQGGDAGAVGGEGCADFHAGLL